MKKTPMRMCIACRERKDKRELLRIIRSVDNKTEFDPTGKKNGRGMYICTKAECIEKLKQTKLVSNALEITVEKENLEKLYDTITEYIKEHKNDWEGTHVG